MKSATEGLDITIVNTMDLLEEMCEHLQDKDPIAFDTETTTADLFSIRFGLVGLSFSATVDKPFYIPLGHRPPAQINWMSSPVIQLPQQGVLDRLRFIWHDKRLIAHYLIFDYKVMHKLGIHIRNPWYCTMMAQYALDHRERQGLKLLTEKYLNRTPLRLKQVTKEAEHEFDLTEVDIKHATKYAAPDASNCYELHLHQLKRFEKLPKQRELFFGVDMPLVPVIAEMEMEGISLDKDKIRDLHDKLGSAADKKISELRSTLKKAIQTDVILGEQFAPTKPNHCTHVIYDILHMPFRPGKKKKRGYEATDFKAIDLMLRSDNVRRSPISKKFLETLLEWRAVSKLDSTYTLNLLDKLSPDGRLHSKVQATKVNSGRFAIMRPNTQNLPKRKDKHNIRSILTVTEPDDVFIIADYDAQEMCVTAAMSG